jgi:hypothetical protein
VVDDVQGLGLMQNGLYDEYNDAASVSGASDGGESLASDVSMLSKISAVSSGLGRFVTMPLRKLSDVVRGQANRDGEKQAGASRAASRVGSRMGSRLASRHGSRKASRQGSRAGSPPRSSPSADAERSKVAWVQPGASRALLDSRELEQHQGTDSITENPAGTLSRGVSDDYTDLASATARDERGHERQSPSTTQPQRQTVSVKTLPLATPDTPSL